MHNKGSEGYLCYESQICIKGLDGSNVFLVMIEQVYAYWNKITNNSLYPIKELTTL
jgi:hypothetical protein